MHEHAIYVGTAVAVLTVAGIDLMVAFIQRGEREAGSERND